MKDWFYKQEKHRNIYETTKRPKGTNLCRDDNTAAIVAIVLVIITQLQKTTTKANHTVEKTSNKIFDKISDIE